MTEAALIQQLTTLLAPTLPALMGIAGKKVAENMGGKIADATWGKAEKIWDKLWPFAEKKPEVAEALKEVAENADDPDAKPVLSWNLKKLLADMPPETVNEIRSIIGEGERKSEVRITHASTGGVAVGGNVSGGTITTNYHGSGSKSE